MGISLGGIDPVKEIVDLRYQLIRTQMILERVILTTKVLENNPNLLDGIDEKVLTTIQATYPKLGIQKK